MRRMIAVAAVLLVSLAGTLPVSADTEEGIQVHGHWKIEILEPNGMVFSTTEFQNALNPTSGATLVSGTIGTQFTVGSLLIALGGDGTGICDIGGSSSICYIVEAGSSWPPHVVPHSTDLQISSTTSVVLEGTVTADNSTAISDVWTDYKICSSSVSPDECLATVVGSSAEFTGTTLPSPVPVDAGQIIQVTVTISFS